MLMEKIQIGNFEISKNSRPYIVGEVGINHNGELNKAFEMIEIAKKSNLDAVKFQTFIAKEFCGDPSQTYTYKSQGKEITESMLEMFSRHEFSNKEWFQIKKKCDDEKINFLSTPQNFSDLELLINIGVNAIKVGSDDLTNLPLLKKYASSKIPIILSSGMSNIEEITAALDTIGFSDGYPTILLVTTSQYPTPNQDVNLLKFHTLSKKFPNLLLGFSDHTVGHLASSIACGMGSIFFEKHFTIDCNLNGPDHWFSANPTQLKIWRDSIITSYEMLGSPIVKPTNEEKKMKTLARRSIFVVKDIDVGEKYTNTNLGLRRPGNGLSPKQIENVIGKKATKKILKGTLLREDDYENG